MNETPSPTPSPDPTSGSSSQSVPAPQTQPTSTYSGSFRKYGCYAGLAAMFAFPRAGGFVFMVIVGAICIGGGSALGRAVGSFFDAVGEKPTSTVLPDKTGVAVASLLLGIVGLVAWFIPIAGLPVTITGFVLGRKARLSSQRGLALTGMGLSLLGLLLSAGNAHLGAMIAVRAGM